MTESFVFDTYAILEILSGNENYKPYVNSFIAINDFVLAELSYKLIREKGFSKAKNIVNEYSKYVLRVSPDTIMQAMLFRANNIKKKVSMTDCISYIMAKKLNIKFLTGDEQFRNVKNVEFVK